MQYSLLLLEVPCATFALSATCLTSHFRCVRLRCLLVRQIRQVAGVLRGCAGRNWRSGHIRHRGLPAVNVMPRSACPIQLWQIHCLHRSWVQVLAASAACRSSCCSCSPAAFLYAVVLLRYFYDLFLLALVCLMFFDWHVASHFTQSKCRTT